MLGDLEVGNGDPHLAILGRALSPNHHALARGFVTLDNFYDSGEQSSTGWTWTPAGRAPDLLDKTAPVNHAARGLACEAEEADRFVYTQQTMAERHATNPALSTDPDLMPGPALLTAPDADGDDDDRGQGFLWDAAVKAGLTVRNYGFSDASVYDTDRSARCRRCAGRGRRAPASIRPRPAARQSQRSVFPRLRPEAADYWRVLEWQREYAPMDKAGTLPSLTLLRLSHDHFGSFDQALDGVNTMKAEMADNDYAVGQVAETIAGGRAAGSALVFVVEDDAQNGADHVDARRSLALVAGVGVKQGALVSRGDERAGVQRRGPSGHRPLQRRIVGRARRRAGAGRTQRRRPARAPRRAGIRDADLPDPGRRALNAAGRAFRPAVPPPAVGAGGPRHMRTAPASAAHRAWRARWSGQPCPQSRSAG